MQPLSTSNLEALNRQNRGDQPGMEKVLVLGAGELGLAVVDGLVNHSRQSHVAVLLRQATLDSGNPDKQKTVQALRHKNVHLEAADVLLATSSDLAAIFARYTTVISCTGMVLPPGTQVKIAEAVVQSKVKRYFPWQYGFRYDLIGEGSSQDLFDEQLSVRKILSAQSATNWTIVSTGLFMSFLFLADFGVVDFASTTVRGLGSWDNSLTLTTPQDIGIVVADVVLDPRGIKDQVVLTAGDTITYRALADLLDTYFDTTFNRELWDLEALEKQMREDGGSMVKYRSVIGQGVGVSWDLDDTINRERGITMTDVKAYLHDMDVKLGGSS